MDLFSKIDTTKVCNTCQFFVKEIRKVADTKGTKKDFFIDK